jgi:hypothetical protein
MFFDAATMTEAGTFCVNANDECIFAAWLCFARFELRHTCRVLYHARSRNVFFFSSGITRQNTGNVSPRYFLIHFLMTFNHDSALYFVRNCNAMIQLVMFYQVNREPYATAIFSSRLC